MPLRTERHAPKFDGTPRALGRYFEELADLFTLVGVVNDAEKIKYAKRYIKPEDDEIWGTVAVVADTTFDEYCTAVMGLYPGADGQSKYMVDDLKAIARESLYVGTSTRGAEAEYYRKFLPVAKFLLAQSLVSKIQVSDCFLEGFPPMDAERVKRRVEIMYKEVDPSRGFDLAQLHAAAQTALSPVGYGGGGGVTTTGGGSSATKGTATTVKAESSADEIARALLAYLGGGNQGGGGALPARVPFRPTFNAYPATYGGAPSGGYAPSTCNFCGQQGHFLRECPEVRNYERMGKIALDSDRRVRLPSGDYVSRNLPGNLMRERVDNWHAMFGAGAGGGGGTAPPNAQPDGAQRDAPPHLAANIVEIVEEVESANLIELVEGYAYEACEEEGTDSEDRARELEAKAEALIAEAARTRSGGKKVTFEEPTKGKGSGKPLPPALKGPSGKPPGVPAKSGSSPAAGGKEVGSGTKGTKGEPQYKYTTKLSGDKDSGKKAEELVDRMLDGGALPAWREIGEVSTDFRRAMTEKSRTYRVPLSANLAEVWSEAEPVETALLVDGTELDFECWDSLRLRTVKPKINGVENIECVLDTGAQMVIVRKDVWTRLGGSLRPDDRVIMETANEAKVRTVGKAIGLRFTFGADLEVILNAQIVDAAPFEVLLGRPFFAATSCETRDFPNGNQEVILTDPKTSRRIMVPTFERGPRKVLKKAEPVRVPVKKEESDGGEEGF
ncbi:uncharacterized protein C8Q71DRAFT_702509 [Rhodofomes roseus]|uniref:CCHC-type domain-containing protein n=1 Tax=Rhodofomes roseus TaxID=34475 RepID=A0ABQ8KR05_9APHY|nr:uncharacterized protein C8Q71DRAFT_702509 [Rhodofomes roseus]KAH9840307.1 hypothetical protein C8Q71DRAFT_702509 [Rhodofomes roseus]